MQRSFYNLKSSNFSDEQEGIFAHNKNYWDYLDCKMELFGAIKSNNVQVIKSIVDNHDIDLLTLSQTTDDQGYSLILCSVINNAANVFDYLSTVFYGLPVLHNLDSTLFIVAKAGYLDIARSLINHHSVNVHLVNAQGLTPLHMASSERHIGMVDLLIEKGANVNVTDSQGITPLHIASYNGHIDLVELLINRGADIDTVDSQGVTPLHIASCNGYTNLVELLVDRGADIDVIDLHGITPLHLTSCRGHADVVQLLINQGADPTKSSDREFFKSMMQGITPTIRQTYRIFQAVKKVVNLEKIDLELTNIDSQQMLKYRQSMNKFFKNELAKKAMPSQAYPHFSKQIDILYLGKINNNLLNGFKQVVLETHVSVQQQDIKNLERKVVQLQQILIYGLQRDDLMSEASNQIPIDPQTLNDNNLEQSAVTVLGNMNNIEGFHQ